MPENPEYGPIDPLKNIPEPERPALLHEAHGDYDLLHNIVKRELLFRKAAEAGGLRALPEEEHHAAAQEMGEIVFHISERKRELGIDCTE